ncbi:MAG: A24 family peptidase [Planctomycetota bacterium]
MYWLALAALLGATVVDLWKREIPDTLSLALFLAAIAGKLLGWSELSWPALGLGVAIAFAASAALFSIGALGGGDVKLLCGLGAILGWPAFLPFALLMSVIGGIAAWWAKSRGEKEEIAYAPVMLAALLGLFPLVWLGQ